MEGGIRNVIMHWMEGEIGNFIKVWISVYLSLCYCFLVGKIVPRGTARFLLLLPVVCLFIILPLNLHTLHLGVTTAFFISWLSNFKILMFAFDRGPLSDPSISLPRFLAVACLPIKIQLNNTTPPSSSAAKSNKLHETPSQNGQNKGNPQARTSKIDQKLLLNYAIKVFLLASMLKIYDYSEHIHPNIILILYCFHIYFGLEIILAIAAALARLVLGSELEPTFNEPLLSTSLQDFWGRRWNIMVTRTLRPSVYDPILSQTTKFFGRKWAPLPAVFSTFIVSGLMHELVFYYMCRTKPTWNLTCFFLLHGACLVSEIAAKKALKGSWRLPRVVATISVVGFVMVTGLWLFLPEMLRCDADIRAFKEYAAVGSFVRDATRALIFIPSANATRV